MRLRLRLQLNCHEAKAGNISCKDHEIYFSLRRALRQKKRSIIIVGNLSEALTEQALESLVM